MTVACHHIGVEVSDSKQGRGYQDAISPPKRAKIEFVLWLLIAALIGYGFYQYGWVKGGIALGVFLVVSTLYGALAVPKPDSPHYLKIIYSSMVRRYADYERDQDNLRADAIKMLINRIEGKYSDKLAV